MYPSNLARSTREWPSLNDPSNNLNKSQTHSQLGQNVPSAPHPMARLATRSQRVRLQSNLRQNRHPVTNPEKAKSADSPDSLVLDHQRRGRVVDGRVQPDHRDERPRVQPAGPGRQGRRRSGHPGRPGGLARHRRRPGDDLRNGDLRRSLPRNPGRQDGPDLGVAGVMERAQARLIPSPKTA
jgi:hypothetical protein